MTATEQQPSVRGTAFANQHVVVLGGSSGIGLAVARHALEQGARVTIASRSASRLESAALQLADASVAPRGEQMAQAHSVNTHTVDLHDAGSVVTLFQRIATPQHLYISAAAFAGGSIIRDGLEAARQAFDTRVWGAVHAIRAAAPLMTGPHGSIVLTGGISTDRPVKGAWPTALGTAATEQLARLLAIELAPLRVNAVSPGWTDTPMWDGVLGQDKESTFTAVRSQIPTGRLVSADEVAQVVLMLMSNRAMNGEVVHVDGGHRLA